MQTVFVDSTVAELPTTEEISVLKTDYENMLIAIIEMLDGAKYVWEVGDTHD